jgi:hypothetical protein
MVKIYILKPFHVAISFEILIFSNAPFEADGKDRTLKFSDKTFFKFYLKKCRLPFF